jgi:hypothetical protein
MTMAEYRQRHPKAALGWKKATLLSRAEAEELYIQRRMSSNAIAQLKGVHPQTIRDSLEYLGFAIRGHGEPRWFCDYDATGNEQLEALALGLWMGEGTKGGRRVELTNCDPSVLLVWVRFLLVVCHVEPEKLGLHISLHDEALVAESECYWRQALGLPIRCTFSIKKLRSSIVKQPMGTAAIRVNSKHLLQIIRERVQELTKSWVITTSASGNVGD